MHLCYLLLSPTFGMHQYTADLANRAAAGVFTGGPAEVHLVTTTALARDRYSPAVQIHTPVTTSGTGFSPEGAQVAGVARVLRAVEESGAGLVHITGVHAWNVLLVHALHRRGLRVIHTLHDLHPHHGVRFTVMIRLWNRLIIASADQILVHGQRYRQQLLASGVPAERVTYAPLLHLFLSYECSQTLASGELPASGRGEPPTVLFFGRVEAYKGADTLLAAWAEVIAKGIMGRLIIAGPVAAGVRLPSLPPGVELRDRLISDDEAVELFSLASLLVLPYRDATQSALVAAAYYWGVPVIVTNSGALPEYVAEGETGWIVAQSTGLRSEGAVAALAATLSQALADLPQLRRMGQQAQSWYCANRQVEAAILSAMYAKTGRGQRIH